MNLNDTKVKSCGCEEPTSILFDDTSLVKSCGPREGPSGIMAHLVQGSAARWLVAGQSSVLFLSFAAHFRAAPPRQDVNCIYRIRVRRIGTEESMTPPEKSISPWF